MQIADLPRTTGFRIAVQFAILYSVASLILFGFLLWQTNSYLLGSADIWLRREQRDYQQFDEAALRHALADRLRFDPLMERPFVLFDASGKRLEGSNIPFPPSSAPTDQPFEFRVQTEGGQRYRGILHRMSWGDLLLVSQSIQGISDFEEVLLNATLWGGAVTAMLGLAGATAVGVGAVRRIDAVAITIQRIVMGDLSKRLPIRGTSDDLDRLASVVNGMLEQLERLMHEVKGVCDNIAHDLRTPLTRLLAGLERARRRAPSPDQQAVFDEAIADTREVLTTFNAMLRIAEVEDGNRRVGFKAVNLAVIAADVVEFYAPVAEEKQITLTMTSASTPVRPVQGDASLLFEAIGNLIQNAIKFTPAGGYVRVEMGASETGLWLTVLDTGPGIPVEEREAVLRRFYRLEKSRHTPGAGLGLSLVIAVARLHHLRLTIGDANPGCTVTLEGFRVVPASVDVKQLPLEIPPSQNESDACDADRHRNSR